MHPTYRADVDGLRAVAVLSVIVFHAFPSWLPGGFIGVDIFFVISGFLISTIIWTSLSQGRFSFVTFYARRVKRIFPALILVLIVTAILGGFLLFPGEYQALGKHLGAAAIYVSNFVLWREAGYFDTAAETKPLLHLWSLAIEEQFYLVWPLLIFLVWRQPRRALYLTGALLALPFGLNVYFINDKPDAVFYLPFTRIWELLAGSLLASYMLHATCYTSARFSSRALAHGLSLLGAGLLLAGFVLIDRGKAFPGWWALLPVLGACCLIAAGPQAWVNRHVLTRPVMVWFGLISYPLYLWHWPLLTYARILAGATPSLPVRLIVVLLSIVLAWLTWRWIETPIRKGRERSAKVAVPSMAMLLIGIGAAFLFAGDGLAGRFSPSVNSLIGTLERGEISDAACRERYQKTLGNNYCGIAGGDARPDAPKVFVIGDSHSQALFSGYGPVLARQGYQVIHLAQSGCPYLVPNPDQTYFMRSPGLPKIVDCNEKLARILETVRAAHPAAILYANDGWFYARQYFERGLHATLQALPPDVPVYYFWQNPMLSFDPMRCIDRLTHQARACQFPQADYAAFLSAYATIIERVRAAYPQLRIVRPDELLCGPTQCAVVQDGGFIFAEDGAHYSRYGAQWLAARLPLALAAPDAGKSNQLAP